MGGWTSNDEVMLGSTPSLKNAHTSIGLLAEPNSSMLTSGGSFRTPISLRTDIQGLRQEPIVPPTGSCRSPKHPGSSRGLRREPIVPASGCCRSPKHPGSSRGLRQEPIVLASGCCRSPKHPGSSRGPRQEPNVSQAPPKKNPGSSVGAKYYRCLLREPHAITCTPAPEGKRAPHRVPPGPSGLRASPPPRQSLPSGR